MRGSAIRNIRAISQDERAKYLQWPRQQDERGGIDEQRPNPMRCKNFLKIRALRAQRVLGQLGLPPAPKEGSQNDRENLASKIGIYSPRRRAAWVVPDKRNASNQCEANRGENPIGKLSPVRCLHSWKILGVD